MGILTTGINVMHNNAPLITSLESALFGATTSALVSLSLGLSPLICFAAYSLGGSATLILTAAYIALHSGQKP